MKPITVRLFIPDGEVYRNLDKLSPEEIDDFSGRCVQRIGHGVNSYFNQHTDQYKKIGGKNGTNPR